MGITLKNALTADPATSLTAQPIKVEPKLTSNLFDFEYLVELVEKFETHNQTEARAAIDLVNGHISLVIVDKRMKRVENYYIVNNETLYARLELAYTCLLENASNGDDFIDRWESFMSVVEHAKITDVEFD